MLLSGDERFIVSYGNPNIAGAIWYCDTTTEQAGFVQVVASAASVSSSRRAELFILNQTSQQGRSIQRTLRLYEHVTEVLATFVFENDKGHFEGDRSLWSNFTGVYSYAERELLIVDGEYQTARRQAVPWFDETYDRDYQMISGATRISGTDYVIVSIARDSHPVIHDLATGKAIRKLSLANRSGNPIFRYWRNAPEVWANDYDTLVRLDSTDFRVLESLQLQPEMRDYVYPGTDPPAHIVGGFRGSIGEWTFSADDTLCAVARPYSYDVVLLDTATFKVTHRAAIPRRPAGQDPYEWPRLGRGADEVALLSDGRAFVRVIHARDVTVVRNWEPYTFP
jgi:hypothetical protein